MSAQRDHRHDDCDHRDDAGVYVLGALDDHEVPEFRSHLAGCATCRDEVAFLQVAADTLPLATSVAPPPPELKGRIMAIVEREAELLQAAGPDADRVRAAAPRKRRWFSGLVLRPPVAAGLACALVALGVGSTLVLESGDDGPSSREFQGSPGAMAQRAQAKLVVTGDRGTLELTSMPAAPAGSVYQVWLVKKGMDKPQPTHTLFNVRSDGRANPAIEESMEGVSQVLVTAERSGYSTTPTKPIVISARAA